MKYQVVQKVGKDWVVSEPAEIEAWAAVAGFKVRGYKEQNPNPKGIQFREEMIGQPIFDGLAGPMYGGPGVVRYEGWSAYEALSQ